MADAAANNGTREHVPFEPSEEWLLVGPKLRNRPEQWPRVRLPAPEPEPDVVVPVEVTSLPAAPKNINYHALKGRPRQPLKMKKRAKLAAGFADVYSAAAGGAETLPAGAG
eukprot:6485684-Amphidinium_carterae.2